jgi:hypothetical protein
MIINIKFPPAMKSWKTTLSGVAAVTLGVLQGFHHATLLEAVKDPLVQMGLFVGILGFFAKDSAVTGGTIGQPSTPQALSDANQAAALGASAPVPGPVVPKGETK